MVTSLGGSDSPHLSVHLRGRPFAHDADRGQALPQVVEDLVLVSVDDAGDGLARGWAVGDGRPDGRKG